MDSVSNVLDRPIAVSPATRERVQTAIAALGFVRNESARHLRAGRSRTIDWSCSPSATRSPPTSSAGSRTSLLPPGPRATELLLNKASDPDHRHSQPVVEPTLVVRASSMVRRPSRPVAS